MPSNLAPRTYDNQFNVRAYGAKGDGSNDDTAEVQAALDAAFAAGGGVVRFPPGTYNNSDTWIIKGNVHIRCDAGVTIERTNNAFGYLLQNGADGVNQSVYGGHSNISVHGGIWDMQGGTLTTDAAAFAFGHAANIEFRDLTIKDVPDDHAMDLTALNGVRIKNCRFIGYNANAGTQTDIEAIQIDYAGTGHFPPFGSEDNTPCKDVLIEGCYFGPSGTAGTTSWANGIGNHDSVAGNEHSNIIIRNNYFEDITNYAIHPYGFNRVIIEGNTFLNCGAGVYLVTKTSQSVRDVTISNNIFRDMGNIQHAISMIPVSGTTLTSLVIANNTIDTSDSGSNSRGVYMTRCNDVSVTGNVITSTGHSAIVTDVVSRASISNNTINAPTIRGIDCLTTTDLVIADNIIRDAQQNGIHISGCTDVVIQSNNIKGAGRATNATYFGINIASTTVGYTVSNNRIRKFGSGNEVLSGLKIESSCTGGAIQNNDIQDTGYNNLGVTPATGIMSNPTLLLHRTTNQTINQSTDTAISWSSAIKNTGPSSWWAVGTPTQIVLPWAGLYRFDIKVFWVANASSYRAIHINRTATISGSTNFISASAILGNAAEPGQTHTEVVVINEATANTAYLVIVWQNAAATLNIQNPFTNVPRAICSVEYLGNA